MSDFVRELVRGVARALARDAVSGTGSGDTTPGGTANALLQEDGVFGFLLEDGTSDLLMES